MEIFTRKQEGNDYCMQTERFTISQLDPKESTLQVHIHDFYEIYYSIEGGKEFFISNNYYDIHPHDIFFIRPHENHHITQLENTLHKRVNFAIHPKFMERYSSTETRLESCFHIDGVRVLHLNQAYQSRLKTLIHRIESASGFGADILEDMYMCELLIMLQHCASDSAIEMTPPGKNAGDQIVQEVIQYINKHLTEELPLEKLSKEFYVSQSYLCRQFKKYTGITINKYIAVRRISYATELINAGHRPNDIYLQAGFRNYNNFFKTFMNIMGISPSNYRKDH